MADQFSQAVTALLHQNDPTVRQQANAWLQQLQLAPHAWTVCSEVLEGSFNIDAKFYAAQTLRTKVQRDYEELPVEQIPALREKLIALLLQSARASPALRTQLCLSLAALALHLPASQWQVNDSAGVVMWLWHRLGNQPPDIALPCMLELLTVLPEEAAGYQPAVRPERRRKLVHELSDSKPIALQILTTALQQTDSSQKKEHVVKAFASWIHLDTRPLAAADCELLIQATVSGLQSTEIFQTSVAATVELIYVTAMWMQRDTLPAEWQSILQSILQTVVSLLPRFNAIARFEREIDAGRDPGAALPHGDDSDTARGMASLFAEVGEAHAMEISAGKEQWVWQVVAALLDVAAYPDIDTACICLNFWHRLSRMLTSGFHDSSTSDRNGRAAISDNHCQAYARLVSEMAARVRYSEDFDSLHSDEQEDFDRWRYDVGDTLLDAASVLQGSRTLSLLSEPLQQEVVKLPGGAFDWRTAEAALFSIRSVYKAAPDAGDPALLAVITTCMRLPPQPRLQQTTALMIAVYVDFLAASLQKNGDSELPAQLLSWLGAAMGVREACAAAAAAVRHLCAACSASLASRWALVSALYTAALPLGDAQPQQLPPPPGHPAPPLPVIQESDVQAVMEGAALVVAAIPAGPDRSFALNAVFSPVVTPMHALLRAAPNANDEQQKLAILTLCDRLGVLFRHVSDSAAIVEVWAGVWPLVQAAMGLYGTEASSAERLCKTLRYALRGAGKAIAPQAQPLLTALPDHFNSSRLSCYLYAASELVKVFGGDPQYEAALGSLLGGMVSSACSSLQTLEAFNEDPELADDTFLLVGRMLTYAPRMVLAPAPLAALLDCALVGIHVQHIEACTSVLDFLRRLLEPNVATACGAQQVVEAAVANRAAALVRLLLAGAGGALQPRMNSLLADVLFSLVNSFGERGYGWACDAMARVPEVAFTASDKQKALGIISVTAAAGTHADNLREVEDVIDEFSESCRRHRRHMEAVQQSLMITGSHQ